MHEAHFRRLLFRGHGRALLHLKRRPTGRFDEALFQACVVDTRYDPQCEAGRASYIAEAVESVPNASALWARVWPELLASVPGRNQSQMLALACIRAKNGSVAALAAIENVALRNCGEGEFDGAHELISCAGEAGYRKVLSTLPQCGECLEDDFELWALHGSAQEDLGASSADAVLAEMSENCPAAVAVSNAFDERSKGLELPERRSKRPDAAPTYDSIRGRLLDFWPYWFRSWGRNAAPGCILAAALDLERATSADVLERLLNVFSWKAYPLDPQRLMDLTSHGSRRVRHDSVRALSEIDHPEVRDFALKCLTDRKRFEAGISILRLNYRDGDGALVASVLRKVREPECFHSLGCELLAIAEQQAWPDLTDGLQSVYNRTPCQFCRGNAVRELHKLGALTRSMLDECLCDSSPETRALARDFLL